MKAILDNYIEKINELKNSLAPMQKTDDIYPKVRELIGKMQEEAMATKDEMLHPTLYNAAATLATAPEGCSVRQLTEALGDAMAEMEMMKEYFEE